VRRALALATLFAASAVARDAAAEDEWYGWPVLITGGSAAIFVAAAVAADSDDATPWLVGAGVASYTLGGPITHWAHGSLEKGFGSLGINVGLAGACGLVGALIGAVSADDGDFAGLAAGLLGAAIGLGVGAVGAVAIDTTLLTYRE
jgi:hypothetical protein